MRRFVFLALLLASDACVPERENPYDPDGVVDPRIDVLQPYVLSCRQWTDPANFERPEGFDASMLPAEEQTALDDLCFGPCSISDCTFFVVLTSAVREPVARCAGEVTAVQLPYREVLYIQDATQTVDIVLPATEDLRVDGEDEGGLSTIAPSAFEGLDDDSAYFAYESAWMAIHDGRVTPQAWQRFRDKALLTRSLTSLDRNRLSISLTDGFGSNRASCRIDLEFDQATDLVSHPLEFAGGYGRHVAVADLDLDDSQLSPNVSRLEFATSYAAGDGQCFADVVFRGPAGSLLHAPPQGEFYGLGMMCDSAGNPGPIAAGRFLNGGDEAFAVPFSDDAGQWVDFLGPVPKYGPFAIDVPDYFSFTSFTGTPSEMAGVGPLSGGARDELALVSPDRSLLVVCSAFGTCRDVPPPVCGGAPSRFADVAPMHPDIPTTEVLVALQSTAGTCIVWLEDSSGSFVVAREEAFPAVDEPVSVHWVSRGGAATAMAVGYLDPAEPAQMGFELPAAGEPYRYTLITDEFTCEARTDGGLDGVGAAGMAEPFLECAADGSGCDLFSFRAIGLPGFDIGHDTDGDGFVDFSVPDEGTLAFYASGCMDPADNIFYLQGLPFLGQAYPTSVATSLASRLDRPRARAPSSAICQVPSTLVMGAPAEGPLGGTGRMVITYNSGDTLRTAPFCSPVEP